MVMTMSMSKTFTLFGFEIKTPKEWVFDKAKSSLGDIFIEYLIVSPIVIGVSFIVYVLVGLFSKTIAKLCVIGLFLYSLAVFFLG